MRFIHCKRRPATVVMSLSLINGLPKGRLFFFTVLRYHVNNTICLSHFHWIGHKGGTANAALIQENSQAQNNLKMKFYFLLIALAMFAGVCDMFAQDPDFVFASSPGVGSDPQCVIAVDVNSDGKLDLITANFHDFTLTVLTNDGSGNFMLASSPNINYASYSVCAVDVNGDGKVDLVSAQLDGTLTLSTNNGGGSFVSTSLFHGNYVPDCICAVDVNGDGKLDLISANNYGNVGSGTLSVFTNNGHGSFVLATYPL
jgi:hypothetical protein